ncbi:hypothetical protein PG994_005357 [Apiospora phragmitis]|uniref:F-box domain-containing protein n=1 Tax=Apiospora phragmitis TaxID=2905665 RepID=A0ABR1VC12_9PEZI
MVHQLAKLPLELLHAVASLLLRPDQAALARTSKTFNGLLTPIIWGDVELHFRGTHEGVDHDVELVIEIDREEDPSPEERAEYPFWDIVKESSQRKYSQVEFDGTNQAGIDIFHQSHIDGDEAEIVGRASENCNRRNLQFAEEENFVRVSSITSAPRWTELAQQVRSLCMSIGVDDGVIRVLSGLRNLRSLELAFLPLPENKDCPYEAPKIRMPTLKNLKLRGYFPVAFLKEVFANAETITHLNLGLLATKFDDKPYSRSLLVWEGGEQDDRDNEEGLQPWAFHSPLWLSNALARGFTLLTHLHLVKPICCDYISYDEGGMDITPSAYEKVVYDEWAQLLKVASVTLRELILEHRASIDNSCVMDTGPAPDMIRPARIPTWQSKQFGKLQHLALRGIPIKCIQIIEEGEKSFLKSTAVPGIDGRPDNHDLLRNAYPDCDVDIFEHVYGIYPHDGRTYESWDEDRKENRQDEGMGC